MSDARLIAAAHKHLGRPWSSSGFDCWECVRAIYSDAFGIVLPVVQFSVRDPMEYRSVIETNSALGIWDSIPAPSDGCVVSMGKREWPHHVGVYLSDGPGRIIHCIEDSGCCISSISMLRSSGWGYLRFHKLKAIQ